MEMKQRSPVRTRMASPSIESGAMQGREHVVRAGWKARARTAEDDDEGRSWGSSWEKEGGGDP